MTFRKLAVVFAISLAASALLAGNDLIRSCATGPDTDQKLAALERWLKEKALEGRGPIRAAGESPASVVNGMLMVQASPSNSPFRKPFDLQNTSLLFTPQGPTAFQASRLPLAYDANVGTLVRTFRRDSGEPRWDVFIYALKNFAFPFYGRNASQIYVSALNGIFFENPPRIPFFQHGPVEAFTHSVPLIAPLLLTEPNPSSLVSTNLHIKDEATALTLTWRTSPLSRYFRYDIQARLSRDGEVLFSYQALQNLSWGAVVVTSGEESWRDQVAPIMSAPDQLNDLHSQTDPALAGMVDIEAIELNRIATSNLLQIRLRLAAPIDRSLIPGDNLLQYYIDFSTVPGSFRQYIALFVTASQSDSYFISGWGSNRGSPAVTIDGKTITMHLLQDYLSLPSAEKPILVGTSYLRAEFFADLLNTTITVAPAVERIETDLGALSEPSRFERPVIESFVVPVFNPRDVWDQLKRDFKFRDDEVDGLAMYQTYMTDIVFYAGAYSTVGNPGADGIGVRSNFGKSYPKVPALLHMNTFDYGWNDTDQGSSSVSLHEFGHRWLYHLRIKENGVNTRALNPTSAHPAEFVHTAAPFNVYSSGDASTMGGARWTDHGNGTFTSFAELGYYSFSWSDLYLMGLAGPQEVEPWFYIEGANPPLRNEYTPRPGTSVTGTRRDVVIQQVIDALGPRNPSHQEAPRTFRVYFVLLTEPGVPPTEAQIAKMEQHRRLFEASFRTATGGRAEVKTFFEAPAPPRRRPVRH